MDALKGLQFADGWVGAPVPANEQERLKKLQSYGILDTPPVQVFDTLTKLARQVFDAPMALVSLVDEDRQWFKARSGIDAEETPRGMAFCAYTILTKEPLVVLDATKDDRFRGNPLVTGEPKLRFYAGAPLLTNDGFALGSFCVLDTKPRESFSEKEASELQSFADLVIEALEYKFSEAKKVL